MEKVEEDNREAYVVTLPPAEFGPLRYRVEVAQDLCWACIWVNELCYECLGSTNRFWLETHDHLGCTATPLERLLQMIRTGQDPEKPGGSSNFADPGSRSWIMGEGRPIVAAWKRAHSLAKHFCDNPRELRETVAKTVLRRHKEEKAPTRKLQLRSFLPEEGRNA